MAAIDTGHDCQALEDAATISPSRIYPLPIEENRSDRATQARQQAARSGQAEESPARDLVRVIDWFQATSSTNSARAGSRMRLSHSRARLERRPPARSFGTGRRKRRRSPRNGREAGESGSMKQLALQWSGKPQLTPGPGWFAFRHLENQFIFLHHSAGMPIRKTPVPRMQPYQQLYIQQFFCAACRSGKRAEMAETAATTAVQRYVTARNEQAFAGLLSEWGLVWRYSPCNRGKTPRTSFGPHSWCWLAGRQGSIRKNESLGCWLHTVAYHLRSKSAQRRDEGPPAEASRQAC